MFAISSSAARSSRAIACRPNAISPLRLASAGRRFAPGCAPSPRWASSDRATVRVRIFPEGPPAFNTDALSFLAALHGFTREEMYEARRILEVGAAGLAAERATAEQVATLAEEVASLFASMQEPRVFLVHDINFHRGVAAASGNPIVASLVEMVSALYYERRRETAAGASERDLRDAAEMHRRIYQAIRARDADTARRAMHDHLLQASRHQAQEPAADEEVTPLPPRRARARRRPSSV